MTTPSGKRLFHIFVALAEFERSIIWERTRAGLDAGRAKVKTQEALRERSRGCQGDAVSKGCMLLRKEPNCAMRCARLCHCAKRAWRNW